jgi:retinol dehydrogenase 12
MQLQKRTEQMSLGPVTTAAQSERRHDTIYARWIAACAAGEVVGIGISAVAAISLNALFGEPQSLGARLFCLAVFAAVGAVEGGALGALQWRVLRTRLPRLRASEWVGVTVAVAMAGWIANMTPSLFATAAPSEPWEPDLAVVMLLASLTGAGAGLCFGAAQWFVLRRHAERAGRWIWIHALGWACAMTAIFAAASLPTAGWSDLSIGLAGVAGGVVGGLLLGTVTGVVARQLQPWVDEQHWSLEGKVCAVTGANTGIGYEIALGFARLGGTVVLLCRREAEGERARQSIVAKQPRADVSVTTCDLSDLESVRQAADRLLRDWSRLDVLVHNAGATFMERSLTAAGIEATLAVDVVGPFLLTARLRQQLERSCGRVITLTGIYQRQGWINLTDLNFAGRRYNWLAASNEAQRGRFLFMSELARRAPRLMTVAVHPGAVLTGAQARLPLAMRVLIHTVMRPAFVRPELGAVPVLRLAARPGPTMLTGRFFDRCRLTADVADAQVAHAFWTACEEMTGEEWPHAQAELKAVLAC